MRMLCRKGLRLVKYAGLCVVIVLLVLLALGCDGTDNAVETPRRNSSAWGDVAEGVPYSGESTMEELIALADVVARVKYKSARQTVEEIRMDSANSDNYLTLYANSIEITFEVLEYLTGSGAAEIKGVLFDRDGWRFTRAEVEDLNENLLPLRTTQWDAREAIVFLYTGDLVVSTFNDPNRYWMSSFRNNGEDGYTVGSRWGKAWLPDAAAPDSAGGASQTEQRFLVNLSSPSGASGQAGVQGDTMTITELKALVTRIQNELNAGGTTEHIRCVREKYSEARFEQWFKHLVENEWEEEYTRQYERELTSGAPAGTVVYTSKEVDVLDAEALRAPSDIDDVIIHSGQDAALFNKTWPLTAATGRPLPEGVYQFYWAAQPEYYALCDALPEIAKTSSEIIVMVTARDGTLHETMFDPVALTSGVGADGTNGVISDAELTVGSTSTSISGVKWHNNQVVLSWSVHTGLGEHKLDFIELDGSVGLSLAGSDATADATAKTLTWAVTEKPWDAGDLLMLRISATGFRGVGGGVGCDACGE